MSTTSFGLTRTVSLRPSSLSSSSCETPSSGAWPRRTMALAPRVVIPFRRLVDRRRVSTSTCGQTHAVDRGEGAEALHYVRVGLVKQIARQVSGIVRVEVAVRQQERQLIRR